MSKQVSTYGESAIIAEFLAPLAAGHPGAFGLKDDCAVASPPTGHEFVLTTDAIAAGVHFFADDAAGDIAWKALAVNISDLAAKAARPVAYLMSIAFPELPSREWLTAFAAGLAEAQSEFGCHLIGGDTDRRRRAPLSITITAIGTVACGRMVRRGTARPGDQLYVSGVLGDAALGLLVRTDVSMTKKAWRLDAREQAALVGRYLRPRPRLALGPALLGAASAAMDISDGLVMDLDRMARASEVAAVIRADRVPLSRPASKIVSADPSWRGALLTGGDDYEILAAVPPATARKFERAAAKAGVAVTCIGKVQEGTGTTVLDADGAPLALTKTGYDHFAPTRRRRR